LALRIRLDLAHGLKPMTVGQIIGLTILTNWQGYLLVGGLALAIGSPRPLGGQAWAPASFRLIGITLNLICGAYLAYCYYSGNSTIRIRNSKIRVPTFRAAVLQFLVASTNWSAIGWILAWLIPGLNWLDVMPVLMISAVAGIWSHVPGGLGVTEAVFVSMLGTAVPAPTLISAVLIMRCIYYFAPLSLALAGYAWLESTTRSHGLRDGSDREPA
jgi:uncharacterized membrane protein YbhN (UPF0104 family)